MTKIQRVELSADSGSAIHCPFCGTKVINAYEGAEKWLAKPCEHTLFAAHDEGFEYESETFKSHIKQVLCD